MTPFQTYHVEFSSTSMTIFTPYPADLQAQMDAIRVPWLDSVASSHEYPRPRVQPFIAYHPAITAWKDAIDFTAIRAEFHRQARTPDNDALPHVEWKSLPTGIMCEVTAK